MSKKELWYHKYRPQNLEDYVWKDDGVRQDFETWVENPALLPNIILAGPWGTGKTTLALILEDLLGLDRSDYLFINASLNTGIDTVRTDIISHCENTGWGSIKVVVLDEAERFSQSAQDSLKGVMDTYGEYTRFIFTTNRLSRMSEGLVSRSRTIHIDAMDMNAFIQRLLKILEEEEVEIDNDGVEVLQSIVDRTYPDMRKAIGLLQQSVANGKVQPLTEESETSSAWEKIIVDTVAGNVSLMEMRKALADLRREDIEDIYRFLYRETEEHEAVVLIAEYLDRHTRTPFPDITLSALLIKLKEIYE